MSPFTPVLASFTYTEMLICLAVVLLLFGAAKLPGIARAMGKSVTEFKAGMKDEPNPDPNAKASGGGNAPQN